MPLLLLQASFSFLFLLFSVFRFRKSIDGICLHCEEDIKIKRLDAVPWAKFCIKCQEAADRHEFEVESGETIDELLANAA